MTDHTFQDDIIERARPEIKFGRVAFAVLSSFLICRVYAFDSGFPFGIGLIITLVSLNSLNFYLLPVMLLGLLSFYGSGYYMWGDMGAIFLAAVIFMVAGRTGFTLWQKSLIGALITVSANAVYYMLANILYAFDVKQMIIKAVTVAASCFLFEVFFKLSKKEKVRCSREAALVAMTAVSMLAALGTGYPWIALCTAMTITLYMGSKEGVVAGMMTGFTAGAVFFMSGGQPASIIVLIIGGMTAGFFKGRNKAVAAACFTAVCLLMGTLDTSLIFTVPYYGPLFAGILLTVLPDRVLDKIDKKVKETADQELCSSGRYEVSLREILGRYERNFNHLAAIYGAEKDFSETAGQQFRGMAQAIDGIAREAATESRSNFELFKYQVEIGSAGYAGEAGLSGDSYGWRQLPDGRFVMVLSDGMGTGEEAARESGIAVDTLINLIECGFSVEQALKTTNSILKERSGGERFATVDMAVINRDTGKAKFYKTGAAITFIKRRDRIETVKMSAVPLGVINGLKADHVQLKLKPGDEILMMSDGIVDSKRCDVDAAWLKSAISEIRSKDPQTMSDLLINKAVENYGIKEKDDLTVLTARIV